MTSLALLFAFVAFDSLGTVLLAHYGLRTFEPATIPEVSD